MKASDEITEEQSRQVSLYDLDVITAKRGQDAIRH